MTTQQATSATRGGSARALFRLARVLSTHPYSSIFVIALALRVCAAAVIDAALHGSLTIDDLTFYNLAGQMASGLSNRWDSFSHFLYHQTASLLVPLTAIYKVTGPSELAGQLFVSLFGAGTAVVTFALARRFLRPPWPLVTGMVVAVYPSQVIFSAAVLKDALTWFVYAVLAYTFAWVWSETSWRRLAVLAPTMFMAILFLQYLRGFVIVIIGIAAVLYAGTIVLLARAERFNITRLASVVVLLLVLPTVLGLGPFGYRLLPGQKAIANYRAYQSTGNTAIYSGKHPRSSTTSSSSKPGLSQTEVAVAASETTSLDLPESWRGALAATIEPFPGQELSAKTLLAEAEDIFWYPLCVLAVLGLWRARRYVTDVLFPILMTAGLLGAEAITEGNLGTAYRHRSDVLWAVVLMAALGYDLLAERYKWPRAVLRGQVAGAPEVPGRPRPLAATAAAPAREQTVDSQV